MEWQDAFDRDGLNVNANKTEITWAQLSVRAVAAKKKREFEWIWMGKMARNVRNSVRQEDADYAQSVSINTVYMLTWMTGITRTEKTKNEEIRSKACVANISEKIREARLVWLGHAERETDADV